jgi:hypothetical protein
VNTLFLLACALLFSIPAQALVILQQASLPINVDYDTNLNLLQQKQGVWRYTTIPKYSVEAVDDKNRWFSNLALTLQRSSNKNLSVDREDPSLNLGWVRELEKGAFSVTAGYDKRSSRFAQFNTNALLDVDGTSVSKTLAANFTHSLTERLRFSLGANYSKTTYTDSSFVSSTSKTINSTVSYDLNEKMSPFVQLSFTDFKPDGNLSQPSTSKNFLIGSTILITPRWTFSPSLGVNSTSTSGTNNGLGFNGGGLGGFGSNEGSGWISNNTLSYLSEKSTFQASLSRSVVPGGLGNLQKTDTIGLVYSRQLTEVSTTGISFNVGKSQSDFDSETVQLSGFYSHDLSPDWQMRFVAGHRSQKQNAFSANNNNVGISLIYNIPQF